MLLIRHGETDRNAGGIALGREDVPLNERGRAQAQALATSLAASRTDVSIAAVYSSPLRRALATAQPLAQALDLEVQTEDGLIEMDVGEAEGRPLTELQERFPDFLRAWRSDQVADVPMPGGESLRQVQERAWGAVESLRERHDNETVAVVSHNFVILTLLCRTLELPLARFRRLKHDLAAVSIVEVANERQVVLSLNDRCHLRES